MRTAQRLDVEPENRPFFPHAASGHCERWWRVLQHLRWPDGLVLWPQSHRAIGIPRIHPFAIETDDAWGIGHELGLQLQHTSPGFAWRQLSRGACGTLDQIGEANAELQDTVML